MKYPKISIVIPSLNQDPFIEETILSLLNQNYPNLELIIADGGSTDNTLDIIKKYEHKIHWWCSEKDKGHADALNKGFAQSSGDIMAWLNSDDKYFPWTLHTVAAIFEQFPEIEWLTGQSAWLDYQGRLTGAKEVLKNKYDYLAGDYQWIQQESVFWRRSLWEKSGGYINENYQFMVDGELWSRFFQSSPLHHSNLVLSAYRNHYNNRAIQNDKAVHDEMNQIVKNFRKKQFKDLSMYEKVMVWLKKACLQYRGLTQNNLFYRIILSPALFIYKTMTFILKKNKKAFLKMAYPTIVEENRKLIKKTFPYKML